MSNFSNLGIQASYSKALKELGISKPTEIQQKSIPYLLQNTNDFIGLAQTGTGKTAAYGLPILHKINTDSKHIQALILSPTRELVQQIKKQLFKFTKYTEDKIFTEAVYGGEKIDRQINNLKRTTHVVVATPGRLLDLLERGAIDISHIKTLVLDEADEMLSMGFKLELQKILKYTTSGSRNVWLFSATMPEGVKSIIKKYLKSSAEKVHINSAVTVNENITHKYVIAAIQQKTDFIIDFLEENFNDRGIVFCRTKAGAQKLASMLIDEGFSAAALEGNMQQKERDKVMRAFKNKNLQVLVATDVAARGIDIKNLEFIIHHQLPEQTEYYTHRSGRTARAGKKGLSIALIQAKEQSQITALENELKINFSEL